MADPERAEDGTIDEAYEFHDDDIPWEEEQYLSVDDLDDLGTHFADGIDPLDTGLLPEENSQN